MGYSLEWYIIQQTWHLSVHIVLYYIVNKILGLAHLTSQPFIIDLVPCALHILRLRCIETAMHLHIMQVCCSQRAGVYITRIWRGVFWSYHAVIKEKHAHNYMKLRPYWHSSCSDGKALADWQSLTNWLGLSTGSWLNWARDITQRTISASLHCWL